MWMLLVVSAVVGAMGSEDMASGSAQHLLQALHCPPCERIHCTSRRALRLQCTGGITTGVCGCCPACARVAGETCGGTWDYLGKCDEGLVCETTDRPDAESRGICKAVLESLDAENCRSDCTREYCQANPSEICSARSVSLEKQECQGSCQHTSCQSCLLLNPPSCPQTCAPSDPSCVHRFGRCVHNHLSLPQHPVCHQNLQSNHEGYFVCLVPACPNALK
ncbi:cysteine-rich motor neuron 1 protein [Centroberyx affinis]|uniref:cysteine-rich motor neuron 1 protein n=1 Tax=Centroberyx affinis TaxID=166261 RepID=UPI003A5C30B5